MHTTIQMWGNSAALRLPKCVLDETGLYIGKAVTIEVFGNEIRIRPKEEITMSSLFEGYIGDYKCEEYNLGPRVGKEIL